MMTMTTTYNEDHQLSVYNCMPHTAMQLQNIWNGLQVQVTVGHLTRFNKIATQGAPQMAVDKEANSLSRVYSYYSKFNLCLFYV